jgi:hypothetical protein
MRLSGGYTPLTARCRTASAPIQVRWSHTRLVFLVSGRHTPASPGGVVAGRRVSLAWVAGAGILALASVVFGLAGVGLRLGALSLLPVLLPPTTAVPLISVYRAAFARAMSVQLRRDRVVSHLAALLCGAVVGPPVGVGGLATLPAGCGD